MTGLFLLLIVGLWVAFVSWLVPRLVKSIQSKPLKSALSKVLFLFLLIAPLADEVIGGLQFYNLCRDGAVLNVNEEKSTNKTVVSKGVSNSDLPGYLLDIRKQYWSYADVSTGEVLVSWNEYRAKGGVFIKTLGISQTDSPIIFNGVCYPEGSGSSIFKKLNIKVNSRR